ncbi:MAG: LEPR-XLL domain-containing protein, partial [Thermoguttaceae bacterium]|nr:LEPR-XLL domain-containing protein [Thermoguttaceae bacterium]
MNVFSLLSFSGKKNDNKRVESRKLRLEALEDRQLLSADGLAPAFGAVLNTGAEPKTIFVTTPNDVKDANDGYTSLREAYASASDGDTIKFDLSEYDGAYDVEGAVSLNDTLSIQKSITIDGQIDGGANIVVDGKSGAGKASGYYRILTVGNKSAVCLNNLTLQNGRGINPNGTQVNGNVGGAVYVRIGSDVTLNNVTLKNNSGNDGGAIGLESSSLKATGATLTVNDCWFEGNNARMKSGGAINVVSNSNVTITNTTFKDNYANSGGAIGFVQSNIVDATKPTTLVLDNVVFDSNDAQGSSIENAQTHNGGGAVYVKGYDSVTIKDSTFSGNTARRQGGAIRLVGDNCVCTIENTIFSDNQNYGESSDGVGAAISLEAGSLKVSGSTFERNATSNQGGGIYVSGGTLGTLDPETSDASFGTFTGNTATQGGAVYIAISQSGDVASVGGATFKENEATEGGAVYVYSGAFAATDSSFSDNDATDGGAIYVGVNSNNQNYLAPTVTLDGVDFNGNGAEANGGAIYVWRGTLDVDGGSFEENTATNGGAIYVDGGTVDVEGGAFNRNVAENGGAIYNKSATTLANASFKTNTAENGGAAFAASGTIAASKNVFETNVATKYGGAVYVVADAEFVVDDMSTTSAGFLGNKATRGGAIANFGTVDIDNTSFSSNVVTALVKNPTNGSFGGAIYNAGDATIDKTAFDGNKAIQEGGLPIVKDGVLSGYSGGAIYNSKGSIVASEIEFTGNYAGKYGGAVSNFATFSASASTFKNNVAGVGGAVQTSGTADLDGCEFTGNVALKTTKPVASGNVDFGGNGGAIFASGSGKSVKITGETTFDGNQAANAGGAIDYIGGSLAFNGDQTTFENNVARTIGGAIVAAGKIGFADGADASAFIFSGNQNATVDAGSLDVDSNFHKAAEAAQGAAGFYAPTVAITCDVADGDITTIAETFFADPYDPNREEGAFKRDLVDTFVSYKVATYNTISYADLVSSFETAPRTIVVEVTNGETVKDPVRLNKNGSITLDSGYNVVRYYDQNAPDVIFRANVFVDSDSTSLSVSKIDVEGIDLGGGD